MATDQEVLTLNIPAATAAETTPHGDDKTSRTGEQKTGHVDGVRTPDDAYTLREMGGRRPSCHKRCSSWLRRGLEMEWRGATVPQLIALISTMVLPTVDSASDWAVTIYFYLDGDTGWFRAGLAIQIIGGLLASLMLRGRVFTDMNTCKAVPLVLLLGVAGLAPVATALHTLYTQDASDGEQLKFVKAAEVAFEALPQLMLQSYVAVSYGRFDPSDPESFDPLLASSICIALLATGAAFFAIEASNEHRGGRLELSLSSKYGVTKILANTSMTAMLVFWVALLSCAVKGWASIAIVAVVLTLLIVMVLDDGEVTKIVRFKLVVWVICVAGTMAVVFYSVSHLDNNYGNASLPEGGPGEAQHFDCKERTSGLYPAVASTAITAVLLPLSMLFDPGFGVKAFRGSTWQERLAKDSEGMSEEDLWKAKSAAVWRYADVFQDGILEPMEIYRLARVMGGDTPLERHKDYTLLCKQFDITALTLGQLHGRTRLPAEVKLTKYVITREDFFKKSLSDVEEWFEKLQLPLLPRTKRLIDVVCGC